MEKRLTKKERQLLRKQEKMNKPNALKESNNNRKGLIVVGAFLLVGLLLFGFNKISGMSGGGTASSANSSTVEILEVKETDWSKGKKDSPVVLIEYLDFECEACGAYYPLVKQLSEEFKNDVLFVSRYFPLPGHKNGLPAALAVEAAAAQGKYWEMHNLLFEKQREWGEKSAPAPDMFEEYALQLGLDMDKFKKDVNSQEVKKRVTSDRDAGVKLGIDGTPSFFLNGKKIQSPRSIEDFRALLRDAIAKAPKD